MILPTFKRKLWVLTTACKALRTGPSTMIQHILANVIAAATAATGGLHIITTLVKNWRICTITEIFGIWYLQFDYGLHRKEMTYSNRLTEKSLTEAIFIKLGKVLKRKLTKMVCKPRAKNIRETLSHTCQRSKKGKSLLKPRMRSYKGGRRDCLTGAMIYLQ